MSTINGLPAHVLLVHFIVVLAPLTAILAIVSAVWPAARRRLIWLVAILAVIVTVLTPLTTEAGEWLEDRAGDSPLLHTHTELGDTMLYFALGLLVATILLVIVHVRDTRQKPLSTAVTAAVAAVVLIAGAATCVQVYRIGDSGARAAWGETAASGQ